MLVVAPGVVDNFMSSEEAIDNIEFQFENSEPTVYRNDFFSTFMQASFSLGKDDIDNAEELIAANNSDLIPQYDLFRAKLVDLFDTYYGIQIDLDSDDVYLSHLYGLYSAFILDLPTTIAYMLYGNYLKTKQLAEVAPKTETRAHEGVDLSTMFDAPTTAQTEETVFDATIAHILLDEAFVLEDMVECLTIADPGNINYASFQDFLDLGTMSYHDDIFKYRLKKDLRHSDIQLEILKKLRNLHEKHTTT